MRTLNIPYKDYLQLDIAGFVSVTLPADKVGEVTISDQFEVDSRPMGSGKRIACHINSINRSPRHGAPEGSVILGLTSAKAPR